MTPPETQTASEGLMENGFNAMQTSEDFLRTMIEKIPILAWSCRPDGTAEFLNQRWIEYTGRCLEEAVGWGWQAVIHPQDLEKLMATWLGLLASGEPGQEEARLRRFDGEYRWFLFRAVPVRDEQGKVIRWYGTNTDIEDLKRAESLLAAEKRVMEMIAGGASLGDILDDLCRTIDAQAPNTITTVLLMDPDGKRLWPTAGPRVPSGWSQTITPLEIGPCVGSCGTAAYLKEPVITSDIASDPLWDGYQDLALSYGLRAAWSQPLISKNNEVLGTFAMYFAEPRSPSDNDLELIKRAGHMALIAIERKRAEEELRRSEAYLAEAQRLSLTGSFGWNVSSGELFWSKETLCILGYDQGTKPNLELVFQRVHPEDLAFVQQTVDRASRDGTDVDFEHRLQFPNGYVKHVHVTAHAVRDESGTLEFIGAVSDITATKAAEAKLRQDERELRRITDAIPQAISVLAPDGTILYANEVVLDYTGLSLEDVKADDFRAKLFHPEDLERLRDERQRALSRGEPFEAELRALRKDGQYRWFLVRYNPLRDEEGRIIRWYATGIDIEDRKQAEERVQKENFALREEIDHSSMFEEIVGSSEALRKILAQVAKVAPLDSTVLILGETGTGKELIARAIHKRSKRSSRAFIRVNCTAIPQSLIASELFGHEKGAFTGALQQRLGRFELADGGTIFLDEIGELPAETQIALLRVLQEREIERVGGTQTISVDVRVVAATNRDLKAAVATGTFRQDLFYRLNVFPIQMPSLRERADDIPLLVEYLIERYAKKAGKKIRNIRKETLELFQAYDWPGNIRELQNVIERAVVLCDSETFSVDETWLKREGHRSGPAVPFVATLVEREKEIIETALGACQGRIAGPTGAAAKLGIPRQTLESKIKALRIDKHRFKARQAG
jgi:PAS domain S-box-containing protein